EISESTEIPAMEFNRAPVLLIEENPETFAIWEPYFRTSEFQLILMENLDRARQWLDRHAPEALISNIRRERSTMMAFLQSFKEQNQDIPVIATSLYEEGSSALTYGANIFLKKPLDPSLLLQELRRMTGKQRPQRLLLVDDNDLALYILRELLNRPWLDLIEAHNGREAIEIIERERPDAVILDLLMPEMNGFEVLEQLRSRQETRNLPVLVHTSKTLSSHEREQLESLSAGVLPKGEIASTLAPELILNSLARVGISE